MTQRTDWKFMPFIEENIHCDCGEYMLARMVVRQCTTTTNVDIEFDGMIKASISISSGPLSSNAVPHATLLVFCILQTTVWFDGVTRNQMHFQLPYANRNVFSIHTLHIHTRHSCLLIISFHHTAHTHTHICMEIIALLFTTGIGLHHKSY